MNEQLFLDKLKAIIRDKLNWNHWDEWTHYNFEKLNEFIFKETGELISTTTLKRFYGKINTRDSFKPNHNTKNTFAKYLGYSDWEDFKQKIIEQENQPHKPSLQKKKKLKIHVSRKIILIFLSLFMLLAISYSVIHFRKLSSYHNHPENITLTTDYISSIYSQDIKITWHVPSYDNKPLTLDFHDIDLYSKNPIVPVNEESGFYNYYYPFPGIYRIQLKDADTILKETIAIIKSNGWYRSINQYAKQRIFIYTLPANCSTLTITKPELSEYKVDTSLYYETMFQVVDNFNIDMNHFTLKLKMLNHIHPESWYCNFNTLTLNADNGSRIRFRYTDKKCHRNAHVGINGNYFNGARDDLSLLTADLEKWNSVRIVASKPDLKFYINNSEVFQIVFDNDLGNLVSVFGFFNQLGEIDDVELLDSSGVRKYFWDFE